MLKCALLINGETMRLTIKAVKHLQILVSTSIPKLDSGDRAARRGICLLEKVVVDVHVLVFLCPGFRNGEMGMGWELWGEGGR